MLSPFVRSCEKTGSRSCWVGPAPSRTRARHPPGRAGPPERPRSPASPVPGRASRRSLRRRRERPAGEQRWAGRPAPPAPHRSTAAWSRAERGAGRTSATWKTIVKLPSGRSPKRCSRIWRACSESVPGTENELESRGASLLLAKPPATMTAPQKPRTSAAVTKNETGPAGHARNRSRARRQPSWNVLTSCPHAESSPPAVRRQSSCTPPAFAARTCTRRRSRPVNRHTCDLMPPGLATPASLPAACCWAASVSIRSLELTRDRGEQRRV